MAVRGWIDSVFRFGMGKPAFWVTDPSGVMVATEVEAADLAEDVKVPAAGTSVVPVTGWVYMTVSAEDVVLWSGSKASPKGPYGSSSVGLGSLEVVVGDVDTSGGRTDIVVGEGLACEEEPEDPRVLPGVGVDGPKDVGSWAMTSVDHRLSHSSIMADTGPPTPRPVGVVTVSRMSPAEPSLEQGGRQREANSVGRVGSKGREEL
jgi:hypothetical protein